jgi:hypothetical protein
MPTVPHIEPTTNVVFKYINELLNSKEPTYQLEQLAHAEFVKFDQLADARIRYKSEYYDEINGFKFLSTKNVIPSCIKEYMLRFYAEQELKGRDLIPQHIYADYFLSQDEFKGWKAFKKADGMNFGLILQNPLTNDRVFVKRTFDPLIEHFYSLALNRLGVKVPESRLLVDPAGTFFYASRDMSRTYLKKGKEKNKAFKESKHYLDSYSSSMSLQPYLKQRQLIEKLDSIFAPLESKDPKCTRLRQSMAKLNICRMIFGINDVFENSSNIGFIKDTEDNVKMGCIDFITRTLTFEFIRKQSLHDLLKFKKYISNPNSVAMLQAWNRVSETDIEKALEELKNPKVRELSENGYYVTTGNHTHFDAVIDDCLREFKQTLPGQVAQREIAKIEKAALEIKEKFKKLISHHFDKSNSYKDSDSFEPKINREARKLIRRGKNEDIVQQLQEMIDAGLDVNAQKFQSSKNVRDGRTLLMDCVLHDNAEVANLLIENGAKLDLRDACQITALKHAADANSDAIVSLLLQKGANPNVKSNNGTLLIEDLVEAGKNRFVLELLKHGADMGDDLLGIVESWHDPEINAILDQRKDARTDKFVRPSDGRQSASKRIRLGE